MDLRDHGPLSSTGKILGILILSANCLYGANLDFNKQIQPILAKHCLHCHGPDPESRKADLRLDTKEGLLGVTEQSGIVVAGNPSESEIIARIHSSDAEEQMPPPDFKHPLSEDQKLLIEQWIKEGANWSQHWAFTKSAKPAIPSTTYSFTNPIDAFVDAKLKSKGWKAAQPASKTELLRRVSLDLTGLPPSPELIHEFLQDSSDMAYERVVEKLLNSPAYGEHRGRYWLDAARYADTHGLHFDNYREIWPYRDWVIQAFNSNLPFDQFTLDQIAGDLIPNPKPEQLIATGFQRCNMTTNEGGTIDEETLATYAADRVQAVSWIYLGLTFNCAQCHNHKFDPITAKDYYAMAAFFRNTTQPAKDGNIKANGPMLVIPSAEDQSTWDRLESQIAAADTLLQNLSKLPLKDLDALQGSNLHAALTQSLTKEGLLLDLPFNASAPTVEKTKPVSFTHKDGVYGSSHAIKNPVLLESVKAPNIDFSGPFTVSVWIKSKKLQTTQAVVSNMDPQLKLRGWDIFLERDKVSIHLIDTWPENALKVTTNDKVLKPNTWHQLTFTYDGSATTAGLSLFVDGKRTSLKSTHESLQASRTLQNPSPLVIGGRNRDSTFKDGLVQGLRVYNRVLHPDEIQEQVLVGEIFQHLTKQIKNLKLPKPKLQEWYRIAKLQGYRENFRALAELKGAQQNIRDRSPVTLIQEEKADQMPMTEILLRGQYDKLGEKIEANVLESLHPLAKSSPKNRLGLAQWLIDPNHPLTARVTVNRFWQEVFGTGIVASTEDFGLMGNQPTHPELLDWLAHEFIQSGWDVKQFFRLLVTSKTYQQNAVNKEVPRDLDPENRWLSRGPRFRMDAEMIRDTALQSSGLYHAKLGGPGTRPYQPEGIWDMVGMPGSNTRDYVQDVGENLYRRSLYHFWKRMAPPPNLETFNAPSREVTCIRRERTNTPLQALVLLNDPQFIQAAIHLAGTSLQASPRDPLQEMALRTLNRSLSEEEVAVLRAGYTEFLQHFQSSPNALQAWLAYDPELKVQPTPELGAWAMVAQQLMNLDEFITK